MPDPMPLTAGRSAAPPVGKTTRLSGFGLASVVFLLDQVTKYIIKNYVSAWDAYTIIPGFASIVHTENPGAAFSLFSGSPSEWRSLFLIGLSAAAMALVAALLWRPSGRVNDSRKLRFGLALIMGGALGNVFDRILYGAVTDFLDLYWRDLHWPAFNVADSAISIGAALVLLDMLRSRRPAKKA